MDSRAKELIQQGDHLFTKKLPMLTLWQEIADNFYPQRADFTMSRSVGKDFAAHLMTSYPILCHRELGSAFSGMLRPTEKEWFKSTVDADDDLDNDARAWLEEMTKRQKRKMYALNSGFIRATKEGDNDFAAFGQCVITKEMNRDRNGLLYKTRHLRDVAWCENFEGKIDVIHDKHKMSARDLTRLFKGKPGVSLHHKVTDAMAKNPYQEFDIRRIVMPSDDYASSSPEGKRYREPYVSIYLDVENGHIIEETGSWTTIYTIPRWQTVSGSQYAYSPCTIAGLPDSRLIQDMTRVLLEAGEKAVNPPMIAKADVIRSDISIFAGGVTWTDKEYDERLGEAIRPITNDYSGIPLGIDLREDVKKQLMQAFYLNKLNLPTPNGDMTAYEVGQRIQEYIRQALPLFEPMETDYNGSLCSDTFDLLMRMGEFGAVADIPQSIRGQDIKFEFESPLHEAVDRQKGHTFQEAKAMLAEAAALDTGVVGIVDIRTTIRDVLESIGTPAKWMRSKEQVDELDQQRAQQQQQDQMMQQMMAGAEVAEKVGDAGKALESVQKPIPM